MEMIVAPCGLDCAQCPAYLATQAGDMEALGKLANEWSQGCEFTFKAEEVACDGCLAESECLFSWCLQCPIRGCVIGRSIPNCAYCDDYICDELAQCFERSPQAKANLEEIRAQL